MCAEILCIGLPLSGAHPQGCPLLCSVQGNHPYCRACLEMKGKKSPQGHVPPSRKPCPKNIRGWGQKAPSLLAPDKLRSRHGHWNRQHVFGYFPCHRYGLWQILPRIGWECCGSAQVWPWLWQRKCSSRSLCQRERHLQNPCPPQERPRWWYSDSCSGMCGWLPVPRRECRSLQ